jgi:DNA-binding GntR family transcriptional regulator
MPKKIAGISGSITKEDWAYLKVREWIIRGELGPGEGLTQETLALRLGISRLPLRAALARLTVEGLVIDRPHQSWQVSTVSLNNVRDIYSGRSALEGNLVKAATDNFSLLQTKKDEIKRLAAILEEQSGALQEEDVELFMQKDWDFHSKIYEFSNMPQTLAAAHIFHTQSNRYLLMYLSDTKRGRNSIRDHQKIMDAIGSGNSVLAQKLTIEHVLSGLMALTPLLSKER